MRDGSTYRAARRAAMKGTESPEFRLSGSSWRQPFPKFDSQGEPFIKYKPKIPRSKYLFAHDGGGMKAVIAEPVVADA